MSRRGGFEDVLRLADGGAVVVTATQHLARCVREAHDRRALASGARAWAGIDVLPADTWLRRLWSEAVDAGAAEPRSLLASAQEQAIWEDACQHLVDPESVSVGPAPIARLASRAWRTLRDAGADERDLAAEPGPDARRVARCFAAFRERVDADGWIDPPSVAAALATCDLARIPLPAAVVLAGFDRVPAATRRLGEALAGAGVRVAPWAPAPLEAALCREIAPAPATEAHAAARWAREILDADGEARVGVVVPDLGARRVELERAFEEVLAPCPDARSGEGERPFSLSLGKALACTAPVADALALLRVATGPVEPALAARVLESPFLSGAERERIRRAALGREVRTAGEATLDLPSLRALVRRARRGAPRLARILAEIGALADAMPGRRGAGAWADLLWRMLAAAGWPGERGIDSVAFQSAEAFRDALAALASVQAVLGPMGVAEAVERLAARCAEQVFAPRAGGARVELSGVLETGGQQYTHLRLIGMDDLAWPPPASPVPLLPVTLQARLEIPGSTPALAMAHATTLTRRLLASADRVVVTHAERVADETRRASPLLESIPVSPPASRSGSTTRAWTLTEALAGAAPELEAIPEQALPALEDGAFVLGGARVLQDQAACGFRAFARHRLRVARESGRDAALDARARGAIVHAALEALWGELRSHARLLASTPAERSEIVSRAVSGALDDAARARPAIRGRLREIEHRRLERLVSRWLERECERAPFEVVAPERDARVRVGPLELELRPDRVDRLDDGRYLVIDYKTGAAGLASWFGERPDDPQVPLYASGLVAEDGAPLDVACGAFGLVGAERLGLEGLGQSASYAEGVREVAATRYARSAGIEDWEAALAAWRRSHAALARAFAGGLPEVDPKRWPATCRSCEVRPLCRVDEQQREPVDLEAAGVSD